jgi:hypothetical protein
MFKIRHTIFSNFHLFCFSNLNPHPDDEEECVKLERATHCCLRLLADLRSSEIAEIPKLHLLADRAKHLQHEVHIVHICVCVCVYISFI